MKKAASVALTLTTAALVSWTLAAQTVGDSLGAAGAPALAPTNHPRLPPDITQLWFVPDARQREANAAELSAAIESAEAGDYAKALPILGRVSAAKGPLSDYVAFYLGMSELRLGRAGEALSAFRALQQRRPVGYLSEAAPLAEAEAAEALDDYTGAVAIYERLMKGRTSAPDEVLVRLGGAAKAAGDLKKAATAFGRVHFEFPLSGLAPLAAMEYDALPDVGPVTPGNDRYKQELQRAERLFNARRYEDARRAYMRLRVGARGDDRELTALRLAECDYYERKFRAALDGTRPYVDAGSRRAEATYFHASSLRRLRRHTEFVALAQRLAGNPEAGRWAEDALDELATHYIVNDEDDLAESTFRRIYERNTQGRRAERAGWEAGWRAYRAGRYGDTVKYFEQASVDFPRSDYRPAWIYWSGRARLQLDQQALALERFALVAADYGNSYYGRLAAKRLGNRRVPARVIVQPGSGSSDIALPPPNEPVIRALLSAGRHDAALSELRYAQRVWADSAALQATVAWIQSQLARTASGREQFNFLRGSITGMRRAYPQFMAAGGDELPREILTTIFPLAHWNLIQKYSRQRQLDEYLVAALVAQESTFVADIRSSAGAVGLMQLMPATARRAAKQLQLTYSRKLLTEPEANVRMGISYLAQKIEEFGGLHLALASYNAGEAAVRRWMAERGGIDAEEFIEDIPYNETRNYVKRILGTAEDYRRLYGS
jgi:soluble lytic murein transglycosylase